MAEKICSLKKKGSSGGTGEFSTIVELGVELRGITNYTYNLSSYEGYQNFTVENNLRWIGWHTTNIGGPDYNVSTVLTYNPSTGVVNARAGYYVSGQAGISRIADLILIY